MKYKYYDRVINLEGWNEKTLDQIRGSMNAFDKFTNHADYKEFAYEAAKGFVKEISKEINGGGGGSPAFATAGGTNVNGLKGALQSAQQKLQ